MTDDLPVENLADAAMRHLQLTTNFTRPHTVNGHVKDLHSQVIRQRAPVSEVTSVLIHVLTTYEQYNSRLYLTNPYLAYISLTVYHKHDTRQKHETIRLLKLIID